MDPPFVLEPVQQNAIVGEDGEGGKLPLFQEGDVAVPARVRPVQDGAGVQLGARQPPEGVFQGQRGCLVDFEGAAVVASSLARRMSNPAITPGLSSRSWTFSERCSM